MLNLRPLARFATAICAAFSVMSLAACGGEASAPQDSSLSVVDLKASDIPADGTVSSDGLTTKNYQQGTLPTDPYRMVNPDLRNYAWDVYVANCLIDKGREPSPVIAYDWNDPAAATHSGWARRPSVDEASQYGYHIAPSPRGAHIQQVSSFIASQPADWKADYDACYEAAAKDPLFQENVSDDLPFTEGEGKNPALTDAMKKWRECMKPLGIPDLPEDAPGMARSLSTRFGVSGADNAELANPDSISAEEITIAVHDAQCNADSGYDTTSYGLVWVAKDRYVKAHMSELTARRAQILKQEDAFKSYIEKNRDAIRQG